MVQDERLEALRDPRGQCHRIPVFEEVYGYLGTGMTVAAFRQGVAVREVLKLLVRTPKAGLTQHFAQYTPSAPAASFPSHLSWVGEHGGDDSGAFLTQK